MTTNPSQQEQAARRLHMVNGQLRTSDVDDKTLLAAFLEVPRERFLPPAFAKLAYLDQDQLALGAAERRVLAPRTLARLLQAAKIAPGERALDVGGGSGYTSAILSALGASVVLLEIRFWSAAAAKRRCRNGQYRFRRRGSGGGRSRQGPVRRHRPQRRF